MLLMQMKTLKEFQKMHSHTIFQTQTNNFNVLSVQLDNKIINLRKSIIFSPIKLTKIKFLKKLTKIPYFFIIKNKIHSIVTHFFLYRNNYFIKICQRLYMAGISYYNIQQIPTVSEDAKIILIGTVIAVIKQQKFLTFVISDSTASAQASFYQKKLQYEQGFQMPQIGDTIQILGTCSTKPIANQKVKLFLKIRIDRYKIITFDQELQITQKIINSRKKRFQRKLRQQVVVLKKVTRVKDKVFSQKQMVDIRSLIFSYMYIVFHSNTDIHSYIFAPLSVTNHKITKQYIKDNQIPQRSLQEAIKRALNFLVAHEVIQTKFNQYPTSNSQQYIIKKRYFQRLIVDIETFVYGKKDSGGATLQQVTMNLNQKLGKHSQQQYLFNYKFVQKMLLDLIHQGRIFKTSDKKLYPNNI